MTPAFNASFARVTQGFLFLILTTLAFSKQTLTPSSPIVDLGYSKYQGIIVSDAINNETKNANFLGIRYAAAPTSTLRFTSPRAPTPTPGIQQASAQPNRCWQGNTGSQPVTPSTSSEGTSQRAEYDTEEARDDASEIPPFDEDCLFLNVYVPGDAAERDQLPVVVWIHGASGFTGTDIQDGNDLIREAGGNVVVVVIQYRLGVFGFLAGQSVKNGGALNVGLLDQQFALTWVQKYISKFGGDRTQVTIWGQSAGAGSVLQHVVANDGKTNPPLFRAAITSSTFLPSQYAYDGSIPELLYKEVVSQTNCTSSRDALDCLRKSSVDVLEAANLAISANALFGTYAFVPVVDGTLITQRPTELLKARKVNTKKLYSNTNTFEGALFVDQTTADTVQIPQYISRLFPKFGPNEVKAAVSQYAGLGSNIFQATAIMGESIFICPTYYLLRAFQGAAYKSEFAIPPGGHGNDLAYYFPTTMNTNGIPPYANLQFDASFVESPLKFAKFLNPNVKIDSADITPHWNMWQGSNEMLFNRTDAGIPDIRQIQTSQALLKRCDFWESVGALTGQ